MPANHHPVQTAITGAEDLGDLSLPIQALAQFYCAFNNRDLAMIEENFAPTDEVAIDNPVGGIRRGRNEPRLLYERIFSSPADVRVEFWDYTIIEGGEMFIAVGRERGTFVAAGGGAGSCRSGRAGRIGDSTDGGARFTTTVRSTTQRCWRSFSGPYCDGRVNTR